MPTFNELSALPARRSSSSANLWRMLDRSGANMSYSHAECPDAAAYRRLARAAHMYASRHGFKVAVRRLANGGVGIWRL